VIEPTSGDIEHQEIGTSPNGKLSGVEEGRGDLSDLQSSRFPSPLVKPDVRISRIRLYD